MTLRTLEKISRQLARRRPAIARPRRRGAALDRLRSHERVAHVDREPTDGWFITLRSGWKSAGDPLCPTHCFGAPTLTEALRDVRAALPCDCEQCLGEAAHAAWPDCPACHGKGSVLATGQPHTAPQRFVCTCPKRPAA